MRTKEAVITRFDLIRHGEPEGGRKFRGSTDDPLSQDGWAQMRHAVQDKAPWDIIVTSPLLRCSEFARSLGADIGAPVVEYKELAEIYLGDWENLTMPEAQALSANESGLDDVTAYFLNPHLNSPPNGESLHDFDLRVGNAWKELNHMYPGQHILVVAHLFTCNLILRQVLHQPLEKALSFDLPYAGLTRIRVEDTGHGRFAQIEWAGLNRLPKS